jgi:hypothetical protein
MERLEITTERNREGAWILSTITGGSYSGYRLQRSYYGYTKREALALFRQFVKEQNQ